MESKSTLSTYNDTHSDANLLVIPDALDRQNRILDNVDSVSDSVLHETLSVLDSTENNIAEQVDSVVNSVTELEPEVVPELIIDTEIDNSAIAYVVVSSEGSSLVEQLKSLNFPKLTFQLDSETIATDKKSLECDVLLLDLASSGTYSIGQVCQRFHSIPVIALLPVDYNKDLKNLFEHGVSDYIYQDDISVALLQWLAEKSKLRHDMQNGLKAKELETTQERAAKKYEGQLQDIVTSSPMIACKWTSPDGYELRFKYISENVSHLGYSSEEILSGEVKWPDIVHPDDVENNRVQLFTATIDGSSEVTFQYRVKTRDEEERWLETHTMLERRDNGMVRYYQGFMLDITERKKAESIREQKNKEIALLGKVQTAISSCQSVGELYDSVTASISDVLGYKYVLIAQYQERELSVVSSSGYLTIPDNVELLDSVVSKAIRRAKPILFDENDLLQYGQLLPNVLSSLAIPFLEGTKVVGALIVESQTRVLEQDDLALLIKVAIQVNLAIENLHLHEQTRNDLVRAQALYEVSQILTESRTIEEVINSVTDTILRVLSARWILSYKVGEDIQKIEVSISASHKDKPLELLSPEEYLNSLTYWAMKHKTTVLIDAKADDPRENNISKGLRQQNKVGSIVAIPIVYNNMVLGVITALNHVDDPDFTQRDANLMTAFVNQVAMAIDKRVLMLKIEHQAFHDALTGLPNRTLFHDRLTTSIFQAKRHKSKLGLLFFDLDSFKTINDTLGHHIGDGLLIGIGDRFSKRVRASDSLTRMGGDEFAIILNDIRDRENALEIANEFLKLLEEPFNLQDHVVSVSASIGVSLFPDDGDDVATLLKYSDIAMYLAKDGGKNDVKAFSPELAEQVHERMTLEAELRTALDKQEFILHYQPQVDLMTGERIGLEALVRWMHPTKGLVPPPKFIPATEETLLVVPLGKWILREACRQNAAWQAQGKPPVLMAVNVSMQQFMQPDFVETVQVALEDTGLDAKYLELEVTEGVVMRNVDQVVEQLKELRRLGVKIALDDFGTGFSSLQYLQKLPFDKLKIDRSFIMDLEENKKQQALVKAIITFAKSFDLETIAEGVETIGQLQLLQELGCEQAQGYYYDKPLEAIKTWEKD